MNRFSTYSFIMPFMLIALRAQPMLNNLLLLRNLDRIRTDARKK
jgi:hypothetical protein